jgi:hypothetical protein
MGSFDTDGIICWRMTAVVPSIEHPNAGIQEIDKERSVVMKPQLEKFEREILGWPHISVHPHRFGGREFRFRKAEVGHVHMGGIVDIPFPLSIRNALLAEGLAKEHRWVPDSGWTTFQIRSEEDLEHGLWLMRLSYLRYALRTDDNPRNLFEKEIVDLHLGPRFTSLLAQFIMARQGFTESSGA